MKKIRYLLAQNNIKPSEKSRYKIIKAVTEGYEKFYTDSNRTSLSDIFSRRLIIVVCCVLVFATLGIGTVWFVKQATETDDPTETMEPAAPVGDTILNVYSNGEGYAAAEFIKTLHEAVYVYNETDEITKAVSRKVAYNTGECRLYSMYNATEQSEVVNVIRTHFAFANACDITDKVDFSTRKSGTLAGGENSVEVIGQARIGTFTYLLVKEFYIFDGAVYVYGADGVRTQAGARAGSTYRIDTSLLGNATLYKVRQQSGKFVVYDVKSVRLNQGSVTTVQRLTSSGAYDEITDFNISQIKLLSPQITDDTAAMPQTESPYTGGVYTFEADGNLLWRQEVCSVINDLGLEWFLPLYCSDDNSSAIGIALRYNAGDKQYEAYTGEDKGVLCSFYHPSLPYPMFPADELEKLPVIYCVKDENGKYAFANVTSLSDVAASVPIKYNIQSAHKDYTFYNSYDILTGDGAEFIQSVVDEHAKVYRNGKASVLTQSRYLIYSADLSIQGRKYETNGNIGMGYDAGEITVHSFDPIAFDRYSTSETHTVFATTGLVNVAGYASDINGVIRGIYSGSSVSLTCDISAVPKIYTVFDSEGALVYMGDAAGMSAVSSSLGTPLYLFDRVYGLNDGSIPVFVYDILRQFDIDYPVVMSDIKIEAKQTDKTVSISYVLGSTGLSSPDFSTYSDTGAIQYIQIGQYGDRLVSSLGGNPTLIPSDKAKTGGNAVFIFSED